MYACTGASTELFGSTNVTVGADVYEAPQSSILTLEITSPEPLL